MNAPVRVRIAICCCYLYWRGSQLAMGSPFLLIKVVILLARKQRKSPASKANKSRSKSTTELVQPIAAHKVTELEVDYGVDVHKQFFMATLLVRGGAERRVIKFGLGLDDLLGFKNWLLEHHCGHIAVESTGVFWWPLYSALHDQIQVFMVNAFKIKDKAAKKSARSDSERAVWTFDCGLFSLDLSFFLLILIVL